MQRTTSPASTSFPMHTSLQNCPLCRFGHCPPPHFYVGPTSAPTYHSTTLSSFTSIALNPLPLVAFSLHVPSRMASALNGRVHAQPLPLSLSLSSSAHFLINILTAAQPHLADSFTRPDHHLHPLEDPRIRYTTSQDGLPVLSCMLCALSCHPIGPLLLFAHLQELHVHALDDEP